mgnify:CR=1 FL=1
MPTYKRFTPPKLRGANFKEQVYEYDSIDVGIYVLKCEQDCFYVGSSKDIMRRFIQHRFEKNNTSKWLKIHRPLDVFLVYLCDEKDLWKWEQDFSKAMIWKYGITKVRGGYYTKVNKWLGENEEELKGFYLKVFNKVPKHFTTKLR